MNLNEIRDNVGAVHPRKVVGRGIGSGKGKTSGKGHKGQKARGTGKVRLGFEGGQNPIYRRMPKRGFNNVFKKEYFLLSTALLSKFIEDGKVDTSNVIDYDYLKSKSLIKGNFDGIKVLYKGEISTSVNLKVHGVSTKAKEAIERVKGSIDLVVEKKFVNKPKTY